MHKRPLCALRRDATMPVADKIAALFGALTGQEVDEMPPCGLGWTALTGDE
jgi:hypothetical protein